MRIISKDDVAVACDFLKNGGLVAFPTETVYGLGGNAYSDAAVTEIFRCKQRSLGNPISVCYSTFEAASADVEITPTARLLAEKFLPGSLTIVLKKKSDSRIAELCSAGGKTIGIRIPNNVLALQLLRSLPFPLAAPSANRSTELSTTTAEDVSKSLSGYENLLILDGGACSVGIESTIVDLSEENETGIAKIVREGAISSADIEKICEIPLQKQSVGNFAQSLPHYRPSKPLIMNATSVGSRDALLTFGQTTESPYQLKSSARYCLNLSVQGDLNEAARNLFSMLRQLDSTDAEKICVTPIPTTDIGKAINERLRNSAKQN